MNIKNIKIKIKKKWMVVIIILVIIIGYYSIKPLFKDPLQGYITESVNKGDVNQEIFETGNVKATEDVNLGFKSIGRVASINVNVGDKVEEGMLWLN